MDALDPASLASMPLDYRLSVKAARLAHLLSQIRDTHNQSNGTNIDTDPSQYNRALTQILDIQSYFARLAAQIQHAQRRARSMARDNDANATVPTTTCLRENDSANGSDSATELSHTQPGSIDIADKIDETSHANGGTHFIISPIHDTEAADRMVVLKPSRHHRHRSIHRAKLTSTASGLHVLTPATMKQTNTITAPQGVTFSQGRWVPLTGAADSGDPTFDELDSIEDFGSEDRKDAPAISPLNMSSINSLQSSPSHSPSLSDDFADIDINPFDTTKLLERQASLTTSHQSGARFENGRWVRDDDDDDPFANIEDFSDDDISQSQSQSRSSKRNHRASPTDSPSLSHASSTIDAADMQSLLEAMSDDSLSRSSSRRSSVSLTARHVSHSRNSSNSKQRTHSSSSTPSLSPSPVISARTLLTPASGGVARQRSDPSSMSNPQSSPMPLPSVLPLAINAINASNDSIHDDDEGRLDDAIVDDLQAFADDREDDDHESQQLSQLKSTVSSPANTTTGSARQLNEFAVSEALVEEWQREGKTVSTLRQSLFAKPHPIPTVAFAELTRIARELTEQFQRSKSFEALDVGVRRVLEGHRADRSHDNDENNDEDEATAAELPTDIEEGDSQPLPLKARAAMSAADVDAIDWGDDD